MLATILLVVLVLGLLGMAAAKRRWPGAGGSSAEPVGSVADAEAEARRWYDRLGGQVLALSGTDDVSRQALADASERYTAAGDQLGRAHSATQFQLVGDTALEGLHYVRAARVAMSTDPGPPLPDTSVRERAGHLTAERSVPLDDRTVIGSPTPSDRTRHYHPGGTIGGRSVPAGWYSEPWWKPMLLGGVGAVGGMVLADALFSGFGAGEWAGAGMDWSDGWGGADGIGDGDDLFLGGGGFDGGSW